LSGQAEETTPATAISDSDLFFLPIVITIHPIGFVARMLNSRLERFVIRVLSAEWILLANSKDRQIITYR
jgi:hypothetical protein